MFATNRLPDAVFSNWTFEAILKISPGADNCQLISMGHPVYEPFFGTTGSYMSISWSGSYTGLAMTLRDREQANDSSHNWAGIPTVPSDGQWHHAALVKRGDELIGYLDYEPRMTNDLSTRADGSYDISGPMVLSVGGALNFGNTGSTNHVVDEIRLSAGAKGPGEFLQPGQPILETPASYDGTSWDLALRTIPGTTNIIEAATGPDGTVWTNLLEVVATSEWFTISLGGTGQDQGVLRVRRDRIR
jgi:hypothetical protein